MKMHNLKRHTPNKKKKLVGRGGKRGKTSGKGTKGQKARAGRKMRPELRDLIKKIPKLRGYKFASAELPRAVVNVDALEAAFASGEAVNPTSLVKKGLISRRQSMLTTVKILGDGELTKKLSVSECKVSSSARAKIEKAGGTVSDIAPEAAKAKK
jgi:large subunit ribosomal protein L15